MPLTAEKIAELRAEAEDLVARSSETLVYTVMLYPQDLLALLDEMEGLRAALKPFAEHYDKRHARYVKRGGSFAAFPDSHPSFDIIADNLELPLGVWRGARRALSSPEGTK